VHSAGVLSPGRWYVGVDAPGSYTLRATLVGALALRADETLRARTLFATGTRRELLDEGASEGIASAEYFYFDPAVHERLDLQLDLLRSGSPTASLDVYLRAGEEFPTSELHDAHMRCDAADSPHSTFVLRAADRLLNERLNVLVVARGETWLTYSIGASTEPSVKLTAAIAVAGGVAVLGLGALLYVRRREQAGGGKSSGLLLGVWGM
jgi:hypothetical protein